MEITRKQALRLTLIFFLTFFPYNPIPRIIQTLKKNETKITIMNCACSKVEQHP